MENKNNQAFSQFNGLTKREYIATQLLSGLFAGYINGFPNPEIAVNSSLEFTDELLKQLAK